MEKTCDDRRVDFNMVIRKYDKWTTALCLGVRGGDVISVLKSVNRGSFDATGR